MKICGARLEPGFERSLRSICHRPEYAAALATSSAHRHMMQGIYIEAFHMSLMPLIPLADEYGAGLIFDFVDHHPLTARVELHEITTLK